MLVSLIFLLISILLIPYKKRLMKDISIRQDIIHSHLINGISNVDTTKGFHLEKRLIDKFSLSYHIFLEKIYNYNRFYEIYTFIKNNIKDVLIVIIYGLGAYYVIKEKFSLGSLILYQTFFSYFNACFHNLISLIEDYSSYKIALDRVEELFVMTKDNFQNNFFYLPYNLKGDIVFSNLTYKIGNKELFHNLNLRIKQGDKILLSGESGSGKSTLLKILLRYIEVDYQKVSIANIDINHYHLENIRSYITYVTSNEYLYTDTVRNNILMYKEVSEEKWQVVCRICLLDDLVKNNILGYDTLIEEKGFNFSNC